MRDANIVRMMYGGAVVDRLMLNGNAVYHNPRTFTVRAKPYPYDSQQPLSQIEEDGVKLSATFSRSWLFFVWDDALNKWDTGVNYTGVRSVDREYTIPTPRYDTYDSGIRAAQAQAFCEGIDRLPDGKRIVIVANHWAGHYTPEMVTRILRCGGSTAKLGWASNNSYILVGKTGALEGNGYHEVLDNITYNGVSNCAEITFTW